MNKRLSSFELDLWFADGTPDGEVATHVASCARCSAYVKELHSSWADDLSHPSAPAVASARLATGPARSPLRFVMPAATVLALAAAVMLYVRSRPPLDNPDYVGVKGAPAVQLLVRSGGATRIWDGRSAVRAGDAIAVHVACEHLEHVTVVAETPSGIARLSDVPCPSGPAALPFTLVVDDAPGHERFAVILTKAGVDDARLRELVKTSTRDRDVWVTAFDFPKESR